MDTSQAQVEILKVPDFTACRHSELVGDDDSTKLTALCLLLLLARKLYRRARP